MVRSCRIFTDRKAAIVGQDLVSVHIWPRILLLCTPYVPFRRFCTCQIKLITFCTADYVVQLPAPRRKFLLVWRRELSPKVSARHLSVQSHLALCCCLEPGTWKQVCFLTSPSVASSMSKDTSGGSLLRPCHLPRRPRQIYRRP